MLSSEMQREHKLLLSTALEKDKCSTASMHKNCATLVSSSLSHTLTLSLSLSLSVCACVLVCQCTLDMSGSLSHTFPAAVQGLCNMRTLVIFRFRFSRASCS